MSSSAARTKPLQTRTGSGHRTDSWPQRATGQGQAQDRTRPAGPLSSSVWPSSALLPFCPSRLPFLASVPALQPNKGSEDSRALRGDVATMRGRGHKRRERSAKDGRLDCGAVAVFEALHSHCSRGTGIELGGIGVGRRRRKGLGAQCARRAVTSERTRKTRRRAPADLPCALRCCG